MNIDTLWMAWNQMSSTNNRLCSFFVFRINKVNEANFNGCKVQSISRVNKNETTWKLTHLCALIRCRSNFRIKCHTRSAELYWFGQFSLYYARNPDHISILRFMIFEWHEKSMVCALMERPVPPININAEQY